MKQFPKTIQNIVINIKYAFETAD